MRGPWRVGGFRWYWMASSTQSVAQGMQFLVLIWLMLELTGSSLQLTGLMVFLYGIPNTAMLPFGGVIADRLNRKYLLMATQAGVGALIGVVAVLTLTEAVTVWHIYLAVALLGVLQALNQPARVTMLSDLVGQNALLDAVAQFNAAVHVGRIVGPPLVGVLIDGPPLIADQFDVGGTGTGLLANAVFYGASVMFILPIRWTSSAAAPAREPLLQNFINGLSVIKNTPVLLTVIVLSCSFGGFGMSHLQVVPVFAKDQLGSDATRAGLMLLASGIGSLAGSIALTFMNRAWLYRWLLVCLVTMALFLTAFGWSTSLLGGLGVVPDRGDCEPGHSVAIVDDHSTACVSRRSARACDGHPALHPRLPLLGCAAAGFCRCRGGMGPGDNGGRGADAAGDLLVRPRPQGRTRAGGETGWGDVTLHP